MLVAMSEPTPSSEPATTPVAPPQQHAQFERDGRRSRLTAVAAWVGIVAGIVFIVAVIFFSGFVLGAQSGGGHRGGHHGDRGFANMHPGGMPPMFPMGPGPRFERPPFNPGGPGSPPPGAPTQAPSPPAPSRP